MRIAVTGSGSGIGRAVADYLQSEGYEVKRVDRNELDLRFLDTVSQYDLSNLDVLINNAATQDPNTNFNDATKESIIWQINVNLLAPILLTHSFVNQNKKGLIINITSGIIDDFRDKELPYFVSKSGLRAFNKALHAEVKENFRCVDLIPRRVKSSMIVPNNDYQIDPIEVARIVETIIQNPYIAEIKVKDHRR